MQAIALDPGTANLVVAWKNDGGDVETARMRNVFMGVPKDEFSRKMLATMNVPEFELNGQLYLAGNDAFELAQTFGKELRRPMQSGVISPGESDAIPMISKMIERLVKESGATPGTLCTYSAPADPVDAQFDAGFHKSVIEGILKKIGLIPKKVTEAHAVILSELSKEKFTGIGISWGGGMVNVCVSGDTVVRTLNGPGKTISELAEEYKNKPDERFWVLASTPEGKLVPAKAYYPRKTGTRKVVRVWLNNWDHVDCTPDHKIMLRDGTFIEAGKLKCGDSLMPLYLRYRRGTRSDSVYIHVQDNVRKCSTSLHRLILERLGYDVDGKVVHHIDGNSLNNNPENLRVLTSSEHGKLHDIPNATHQAGALRGKTWEEVYGAERANEIKKKMSDAKKGKTKAEILGSESAAKEANERTRQSCIGRTGKYERTDEIKQKISEGLLEYHNHQVSHIEELPEAVDVYDMAVDEHHNFAIGAGIFVHNCVGFRSIPVVSFSSARSGDFIDEKSAQACGETKPRMSAIKEAADFSLTNPVTREQSAIVSYYKSAIEYTVSNIKKRFEEGRDMPRFTEPVSIVLAGGTAMVPGFVDVFKSIYEKSELPISVKDIRVAETPLYTVSRGCLIAANI